MTASALYTGTVRHRRFEGRAHRFEHGITLAYLDLDELPDLLGGRLVRRAPGVVRVRRRDLLGGPDGGLPPAEAVREAVRRHAGVPAPEGPVRVLTQPRVLGHCFNPVSFYFCFTPQERLDAVVAEVTNTPWGERHAYVLTRGASRGRVLGGSHDKALHVSPFMDMAQRYAWRVGTPGATTSVHIENRRPRTGAATFDATLRLARRELTPRSLRAATARHPAGALRVLALIYGHAVGLKLRGVAHHPHPSRST